MSAAKSGRKKTHEPFDFALVRPAAFRPPIQLLLPESADCAVGGRNAIRIPDARPGASGEYGGAGAALAVQVVPAAARQRPSRSSRRAASSSICRRTIPASNRWIPDGELGRRVRFLDRFFDQYVMNNMSCPVFDALRPEGSRDPYGVEKAMERLRTAYDWLEANLGEGPWAVGESFTLADCAAAPSLFYADWVEEIGPSRPTPRRLSRAAARPSGRGACGRRRPAISFVFPAWRARTGLIDACM